MKALTIRQPWASLIALGVKRIETRSWSTRYRGPLAIHAGKAGPDSGLHFAPSDPRRHLRTVIAEGQVCIQRPGDFARPLPLGAVVATAELVDVVPMVDWWPAPGGRHGTPEAPCLYVGDRYPMTVWRSGEVGPGDLWQGHEVEQQRPLGVFAPGRFAWMLDNVRPLDPPVPATGRQGLWTWEARS